MAMPLAVNKKQKPTSSTNARASASVRTRVSDRRRPRRSRQAAMAPRAQLLHGHHHGCRRDLLPCAHENPARPFAL